MSILEKLVAVAHCEKEAEPVEDAVEAEEPEDPRPAINEECGKSTKCAPARHHLDECAARVESGVKEDCTEEFFHFVHCVDHCAARKLWAKLA